MHPSFLKNIGPDLEVPLSLDISSHSPDLTQVTQVVRPDISASNIDLTYSINGFLVPDFNNVKAHISKLFNYLLIIKRYHKLLHKLLGFS